VRCVAKAGDQVFTMSPEGNDVRQLTFGGPQGESTSPAWSPDGRRLAFVSRRDGYGSLYLMEADGAGEQRLTTGEDTDDGWPAWSPDGTGVLCARGNRVGADALLVVDVATGSAKHLTEPGSMDSYPAWSPDGALIAFRRAFGKPPGIYVLPPCGGEPWFLAPGGDPSWSPTGDRLAFSHGERLWVLPVTSEGRLAGDAEQVTHGLLWRDSHPTWSPDGRRLAFARARTGERGDNERIMRLDLDTGDLTDLAEGQEPDWSPAARKRSP
jgi:Tol biopolymer transport system component